MARGRATYHHMNGTGTAFPEVPDPFPAGRPPNNGILHNQNPLPGKQGRTGFSLTRTPKSRIAWVGW